MSRPSFSACSFDLHGARNHQRFLQRLGDVLARHHARGQAQILQARVGAGADEDAVERNVGDARAGLERHVLERARRGLAVHGISKGIRVRNAARNVRDHAGVGAPGDLRRDFGGVRA